MNWKLPVYFRTLISNKKSLQFQSKPEDNMEEVILRFPHLALQIFHEAGVRSLSHCKEVCRSWSNFIETEKPLKEMFEIMRIMYGQVWKDLPSCFMDWAVNNIHYIKIKWKQRGFQFDGNSFQATWRRIYIFEPIRNKWIYQKRFHTPLWIE